MQTTLSRDIDRLIYDPPELGTVLYLPGLPGGGSTIYDRSPYGNQGTIAGAVWKRLPSGVWYPDLDGTDDYVACTSYFGDINFKNQAFTAKMWTKFDVVATTHSIFGIKPTTATNFGVRLQLTTSDAIIAIFLRADNDVTGRVCFADITRTLVANKWYQFVLTYDGTGTPDTNTFKLYVDGADYVIPVYVAGYTGGTWKTENNTVFIGGCNENELNGQMALEGILNIAWTAGQVQDSFNEEKHLFNVW